VAGCAPDVSPGPELPVAVEGNIFAADVRLLTPQAVPVLDVAVGEGEIESGVRGAVVHDGGLVVTNVFVRQVLFLDEEGRVVARQGQDGFGPGEYITPTGVAVLDGKPLVWDAYHRRISVLDGPDTPPREAVLADSTPPYFPGSLIGAFDDVVFLRFDPSGYQGPPTGPVEARQDAHFLLVDARNGATRSRWVLPGAEEWVARIDRNHGGLPVAFGRRPVAAVAHQRAYTADTGALVLSVHGAHGHLGSVTLEGTASVETETAWADQVRDSARAQDASHASVTAFRTTLLDAGLPARETLPAFSDMMGSTDGRYLWIRSYPRPGDTTVTWVALDESLRPALQLQVPTDMRVRELSEHHVLAWTPGWAGSGRLSLHLLEEAGR